MKKVKDEGPRKLPAKELARVREIVRTTPMSAIIYHDYAANMGRPRPSGVTQEDMNGFHELVDIERMYSVFREMYRTLKDVFNERPEFAVRFVAFSGFTPSKFNRDNSISQMAKAALKGALR